MGCHFLLQGVFWTQGLSPPLWHRQVDSLPLSHLGSPSTLFVVGQSPSCVQLFVTTWTAAHQLSLFFIISQNLLKLMSTKLVMLSRYLIFSSPFLLPSFSVSCFFASGGQSMGVSASASVLPMNIQG